MGVIIVLFSYFLYNICYELKIYLFLCFIDMQTNLVHTEALFDRFEKTLSTVLLKFPIVTPEKVSFMC